MIHRYRRPVLKLYRPDWYDRTRCKVPPDTIVRVVASWGPFRGIETVETPSIHDACIKGSLIPVPRWAKRRAAFRVVA